MVVVSGFEQQTLKRQMTSSDCQQMLHSHIRLKHPGSERRKEERSFSVLFTSEAFLAEQLKDEEVVKEAAAGAASRLSAVQPLKMS